MQSAIGLIGKSNPGVEERIRNKVAAAAKVELAVVFGFHFR